MGIFKNNYVIRTEIPAHEVKVLFTDQLVSYFKAREQELTNNFSIWALEELANRSYNLEEVSRQSSEFIVSKINITFDHESTRIEITTKYTLQFYLGWLTWIFVFFFVSWVLPLILPVALVGLFYPVVSFKLRRQSNFLKNTILEITNGEVINSSRKAEDVVLKRKNKDKKLKEGDSNSSL